MTRRGKRMQSGKRSRLQSRPVCRFCRDEWSLAWRLETNVRRYTSPFFVRLQLTYANLGPQVEARETGRRPMRDDRWNIASCDDSHPFDCEVDA